MNDDDKSWPDTWHIYSDPLDGIVDAEIVKSLVDLGKAIDGYNRRAETIQQLKDSCGVS
jgi:hypothetical protein